MNSHGTLDRVGVEATGCWGAGLTRHLTVAGIEVIEANRPDRNPRRRDVNHTGADPLDEHALCASFFDQILFLPPEPLTHATDVCGPEVYLLMYDGPLDLYGTLAGRWPIYAGSAVSLAEHFRCRRAYLNGVKEFAISEFHVAFLATSSRHVATYLEGHACDLMRPVWNQPKLAGFGSRFQGAARASQRRAPWSVLHPGRRCRTGSPLHSRKELIEIVAEHLTTTAPPPGIFPFDL